MPRMIDDDDDDDDILSQHSKDSDDRDLEVYAKAVAEFKVTWQKQKKEKENKFLRATQAELDVHVNRKKTEVDGILNDMEATYQDFLAKYTAIEDQKREVIVKLAEAMKPLVALSVKKHQEMVELTHDLEEGQLEGIKQAKETYKDFAEMVESFMKVEP